MRATPHTVSYSLGNLVFLKFFRHPEEGSHPELELLNVLHTSGFTGVPRLLASMAYRRTRGDVMTLAVAMEYMQDAEEGTAFVMDGVDRYFEQVLASGVAPPVPLPDDPFLPPDPTEAQSELMGEYTLEFFRRLGQRTSQLHKTLAGQDSPAFVPEPITKFYLRSLYQSMRNLTNRSAQSLERAASSPEEGKNQPPRGLPVNALLQRFARLLSMEPTGLRVRIHGDFQLDNVLHIGKDFLFVDFDGDVRVPLSERAFKRSVLKDVASMIFSIGMTVEKAFRRHLERNPSDRERLVPWLSLWRRTSILTYLTSYLQDAGGQAFLPQQDDVLRQLLMALVLEQNLRSISRSLEEAPDDVPVLLDVLDYLLNLFP